MGKILVTGSTGNVGKEIAKALRQKNAPLTCAVRDVQKAEERCGEAIDYVRLDYQDESTFEPALEGVDRIFLMFPPETPFAAFHSFIAKAREKYVKHIVYLSVKDVQYMPFIPHYKNEKYIKRTGMAYTFLRAGYFMQNLNMFLLDELQLHQRIYVPAGKGKTSFTDIRNIAEIGAMSLTEGGKHLNQKYTITGHQSLTFMDVAQMMSLELNKNIVYSDPPAKEFKSYMLAKGLPSGYINVVIGLHMATKVGLAGGITPTFTKVTGKQPIRMEQYLKDYRQYWL